jgi:hypothetical protein
MIRVSTMIFAATFASVVTAQAAPQPNQPEQVNGAPESTCKIDPRTFDVAAGAEGLLAALGLTTDTKAASETAQPPDAK